MLRGSIADAPGWVRKDSLLAMGTGYFSSSQLYAARAYYDGNRLYDDLWSTIYPRDWGSGTVSVFSPRSMCALSTNR